LKRTFYRLITIKSSMYSKKNDQFSEI